MADLPRIGDPFPVDWAGGTLRVERIWRGWKWEWFIRWGFIPWLRRVWNVTMVLKYDPD